MAERKLPWEEKEEADEGISVTKEEPFELHEEAQKPKKKHTDSKSVVKQSIIEMEDEELFFTREEIVKHAKTHGVSEREANDAIDELLKENWIMVYRGTNMLCRSVWKDYSPAFEEYPEY